MGPEVEQLFCSIDPVTAELIRDVLQVRGMPCAVVARGFDGVTIGHTPRDNAVLVPRGSGAVSRELLVEAWGEDAVARLESSPRPT